MVRLCLPALFPFVPLLLRDMTCMVLDLVDDAFDSRPALCLFSVCREEYSAALVSTTALACLGCFAGVDAPRAMFPFTAQCLVPSGTCYASVFGWLLEEFHDFLREGVHSAPEVDSRALAGVFNAPDHFFHGPLFLAATGSVFGGGVQDHIQRFLVRQRIHALRQSSRLYGRIFTLFLVGFSLGDDFRIVSVFSAELGSTANTCAASVYEAFWKNFTLFLVVFLWEMTSCLSPYSGSSADTCTA